MARKQFLILFMLFIVFNSCVKSTYISQDKNNIKRYLIQDSVVTNYSSWEIKTDSFKVNTIIPILFNSSESKLRTHQGVEFFLTSGGVPQKSYTKLNDFTSTLVFFEDSITFTSNKLDSITFNTIITRTNGYEIK